MPQLNVGLRIWYTEQVVLKLRTILAATLCLSMIVATAPATPDIHPAEQSEGSGCCHHEKHSTSDRHESNKPCHTPSCVMQCCRLLPVQSDTRPVLTQAVQVVRAEPLPLVVLHSLAAPEAIFHPPKA